MLNSILRLSVGTFSAFVIIVGGLIAFTALIFRFNLIWIDPQLITLGFGVCLIITSFLLRIAEARRASRWFATIGGALILSFTIGRILTRTSVGRAIATFLRLGGERVETAARIADTPKPITCEPPLFIGDEGYPRYWWSPQDLVIQSRTFTCYDRPGTHPDLGTPLLPVTSALASLIAKPSPTPIASAPPAAPAVQPTLPPVTEHKGVALEQPPPVVEDQSGAQYTLPHS